MSYEGKGSGENSTKRHSFGLFFNQRIPESPLTSRLHNFYSSPFGGNQQRAFNNVFYEPFANQAAQNESSEAEYSKEDSSSIGLMTQPLSSREKVNEKISETMGTLDTSAAHAFTRNSNVPIFEDVIVPQRITVPEVKYEPSTPIFKADDFSKELGRPHKSSFNSGSSGDESVVAQSRCSMCDGCSSSPCASHYACTQTSFADSEFSDYHSLKWDDHNFQGDETVDSLLNDFIEISHERPGQKFLQTEVSTSGQHLIFLLIRILLVRYKQIVEEAKEHKTIAKSQKKTIVCLVQSVLLLVKRNQDTENRLERLRRELTQMRIQQTMFEKQQRKMYLCLSLVLGFHFLSLPPVKSRLSSLLNVFGFVKSAKKMNSFRQSVGQNWRNIPSLLTEFLRLFIFRSQLKTRTS
ncbi:uncharacterized protein LOC128211958 [Mya arenaria]|uniref:uncharacterized protein LOC128211958 n=1 Tax=Mya arenaria TaxID=6604 RepID=UPI0022E83D61|nr:uncharacterized protein LOC128211958 [Mya arenaria]